MTTTPEEELIKYKRVKTPTVFQMETVECGAAALAIVLGYHGCYIPLEQLREDCGVSRDGCKAINIIRAAQKYGLEGEGYRRSIDHLMFTKPPFIAFWQFSHFVVIEGFKWNRVYINDPNMGPRTCTLEEFSRDYSGVILTFTPTEKFKKQGKPPRIYFQVLRRLKGQTVPLTYLLLLGIASTVLGLLTPIFGKIFVDYFLVEHLHSIMRLIVVGVAATCIVRFFVSFLESHYLLKLENKLAIQFSSNFLWQLMKMPLSFFSQRYVGDITHRMELNRQIASFISGIVIQLSLDLMLVIMYLFLMFYFDVTLSLITLGIGLTNVGILYLMSRMRRDKSLQLSVDTGNYYSQGFSGLRLIESVKASGAEQEIFSKVVGSQANVANTIHILDSKTLAYTVLPSILSMLNSIAILIIGAYRVMQGDISVGTLVAMQAILAGFSGPLSKLVLVANSIPEMAGTIAKLDDVMQYKEDKRINLVHYSDPQYLAKERKGKLQGKIEIKNLTYGFNRLEKPLLVDINLEIHPGEHIAIVGTSGSGKTTLTKILANLYEPWEGEVLIDNKNMNEINRLILINSLSLVEQENFLFNCKIKDNITMWDETISLKQVIEAAKDAGIHEEISLRLHGYDDVILENGSNFSGGQRQRFEIARSLAINPTILILDEATSELDPISESLVYDNIRKRGCTTIIAAHRLSTVRNADRIIVLKAGRIVQSGTHTELIAQSGHYQRLMTLE